MRTASAWAPGTSALPKKPPWTHAVCSPSWQKMQVPSENANGMTTTSPTLTVRTSPPTASTTPIASCPMTTPLSLRSSEVYGQRSLPQMQAGPGDADDRVCRLDDLGIGDVLDPDVAGCVHDGGAHQVVTSGACAYSSSVTWSPQVTTFPS